MRFLSPSAPVPGALRRPAEIEVLFPAEPLRAKASGELASSDRVRVGAVDIGPGRLVVPEDHPDPTPRLWLTDDSVSNSVACWAALAEQFSTTGLWPLLLQSLDADLDRPWGSGELRSVDDAVIDRLDVEEVLQEGWDGGLVPINDPWAPGTGPLAPFHPHFPGLAPGQPVTGPVPVVFEDGAARIGLVSCGRPADAIARAGWMGAINVRSSAEVSAVLRSWENRFGAIPVGLGFATLTLVVTRPPTSDDDALRVAAEVAALCPDALWQPESSWPYEPRETTLAALSRHLVREHIWRLWFD